jgi:hypothetical protein
MAVNAEVRVPTCKPTVDATAPAVPTTSDDLHRTALEDVHIVDSPAVPCTRSVALVAARPALLPSKVTLAAPVDGPFAEITLLRDAPTAVNADVRLSTCEAAEATSARPEPTTDKTLHATALADVHEVVSLALPPSRQAALKPA